MQQYNNETTISPVFCSLASLPRVAPRAGGGEVGSVVRYLLTTYYLLLTTYYLLLISLLLATRYSLLATRYFITL